MKKRVSLLLCLVMLISALSGTVSASYSDTEDHWAKRFIDDLSEKGIVNGTGNDSFRPDDDINVDEFLKMALTAMGKTVTSYGSAYWAEPYIEEALKEKLVYSDEFSVYNRAATRGEIAKIAARAIDASYVSSAEKAKIIANISDYYDILNDYKEYVLAAYENKLISGYGDNSFGSAKNMTRAEACVVITRMMNVKPQPQATELPGSITEAGSIYYVSTEGSDENEGSEAKPFATIEKARDTIREIIAAGKYPAEGITVYLRGGDYELTKGIEFTSADSGTAEKPVTYASYPGETAHLTGSKSLSYDGFTEISADMAAKLIDRNAASKVLQYDLKKAGITNLGQLARRGFLINADVLPQAELYIDGSRMQLSRWPNSDWAGTSGIVRSGARSQKGVLEGAVYKIDYDRPTKWKTNINEIYTAGVLGPNYFYGYFPIDKIEQGQITLKEGSVTDYYSKHFIRYENVFEETDAPGEYYIDRNTGMLYLYPTEDFGENSEIRLSMLEDNMITGNGAKNITLKGLRIDIMRATAIRMNDSENFTIDGCDVGGTGRHGIYIKGTNCAVRNSVIHDIGWTGINMNGGDYNDLIDSGNVIENNHIYKAAQIERSYQSGITLGFQSVGVRVSHNEINDMPHAAMIVYGPDHLIEYNNIHDAVKEFHDMDAIYLNVYQYPWERGVTVKRNFIHDLGHEVFTEKQMNVAGIRSDNNGNGLNIEENVFYNLGEANSNGIRGICAEGIDNVVKNNIFVDTAMTYDGPNTYNPDAKWDLTKDSVKSIYDNFNKYAPVYSQKFPEIMHFFTNHFSAYQKGNTFKDNVIVNIAFPMSTLNGTPDKEGFFAASQLVDASGNIITKTDPGFADYAGRDFTLKATSEVYARISAFPQIDFENIGLLKDTKVGTDK